MWSIMLIVLIGNANQIMLAKPSAVWKNVVDNMDPMKNPIFSNTQGKLSIGVYDVLTSR